MPEEAAFADEVAEEAGDTQNAESRDQAPAAPARAHRVIPDALYGALPISRWAQTLLELAPFARLAGVSLSDAPGELLFNHPFPSRLTHSLGVYYLARQARPRDRALHAAALAHDLGHGPFSHLTEPLMIERLGIGHEQRSALLLRQALAQVSGVSARLLAWLDPDEVTALMLGQGADGRGRLLNGLMDYDNLDNVARFLKASELGD
ncbi:MAG TPA: HD domain-containing protein, partial [Ktedonobacterales bacterium]